MLSLSDHPKPGPSTAALSWQRWQEEMAAPQNQTPNLSICPSLAIMHQEVDVTYKIYGRDASLVSFSKVRLNIQPCFPPRGSVRLSL